jgi:hypothetical protein
MSDATIAWTPIVTLDLTRASSAAFEETAKTLAEDKTSLAPLTLKDGWMTVTPEIAERMLRANASNRKVSLAQVKRYAFDMINGQWAPTNQGLGFDKTGRLVDGQHRLWACYLSGASFETFVIASVRERKHLFAYIDNGKLRTAGDALYTAGANGVSPVIAAAVHLSHAYDNKLLNILRAPKMRRMSNAEVLQYAQAHPDLARATHHIVSNFSRAINVIGSKPVTAFFGWKAILAYGEQPLEDFLTPLGSGANLAEDNVILGLRNRLLNAGQDEDALSKPHRLALLIKAFQLSVSGEKLPKRGLYLRDNEPFPRLEPQPQVAEAAQ